MKRLGHGWAAIVIALVALPALALAAPGDLDSSFAGDGTQTVDMGIADETAYAHAVTKDGRIYVAGARLSGGEGTQDQFEIFSLTPAGALDTAFSTDGKLEIDMGSSTIDHARAVAIDANGRIVLGGNTNLSPSGSGTGDKNFGLVRILPGGTVDPLWSEDGRVATDFSGTDVLSDLVIDDKNRTIAVGTSASANISIARYLPAGELDFAFDSDGKRIFDLGGTEVVRGVALAKDGDILISGKTKIGGTFGSGDFFLLKVNPNGSLDSGFADNGVLKTGVAAGHEEDGGDVAVGPDGRIVVAGWAGTPEIPAGGPYDPAVPSEIDLAAIRVTQAGQFDSTFSGNGRATFDLGPATESDFGRSIVIAPDSKLIIAGESGNKFMVARITAAGILDDDFFGDGARTVSFGAGHAASSAIGAVTLTPQQGDIIASGQTQPTPPTDDMAVAKIEGDPINVDTTITSGPPVDETLTDDDISFGFTSPSPGVVEFECAWPNEIFESCTSVTTRTNVADGNHTFRVRAINSIGAVDATPAARSFTIDTTAPFITIRRRSLRVGDDGKTAAKIRCGFERSDPCQGKLVVRTVGKFRLGDAGTAARKGKSKTVKLAQAKFSIESEAKPAKISLKVGGERKLKLLRRNELARKVNVTVRVRDQVGNKDRFIKELRVKL